MAIVQSLDLYDFKAAFERHGRSSNFSDEGLEFLFNHLEEIYSNDNWELDVIALCCEYGEYSYEEAISQYDIDVSECENEEEIREAVIDFLNYHSSVCGCDDDIVVFAEF